MISPDVHFGIAPAGNDLRELGASPVPGLTTVELPFGAWAEAWAGTLAPAGPVPQPASAGVLAPVPVPAPALAPAPILASAPTSARSFSDLCLRLGEDFIGPAEGRLEEGGLAKGRPTAADREAAYAKAVADCRRLMDKPWAKAAIAALLIEFPASCCYGAAARRHLDRVTKDLSGLPLAVAFYGADWYSARVIEGLKARGVALCLLDMPRKPGSPPSIDVVTSSLVYLKLNDRTDLSSWLPRLEALAAQAAKLRVIFSPGGGNAAGEDGGAAGDGNVTAGGGNGAAGDGNGAAASAALMAELWAGLSGDGASKRADDSTGGG